LNTIAFVGENYQPTYIQSRGNRSDNRVDIDASGDRPGNVEVPSPTFLQNSLVELPQASLNTEILLANSCIQRRPRQRDRTVNRFIVTGSDGLPSHPGNASLTTFPTGTIRRLDTSTTSDMAPSWQLGDAIIEPQGVYQLSDGRLVLSRECSESTL
jgi:large exoprotein involved in heme utilization and adhesion